MPIQMRDPQQIAVDKATAGKAIRLRDPLTGALLHLSGQGTTTNPDHSWLGFRHQADTLRDRALATGEAWPFVPVHRDLLEGDE